MMDNAAALTTSHSDSRRQNLSRHDNLEQERSGFQLRHRLKRSAARAHFKSSH